MFSDHRKGLYEYQILQKNFGIIASNKIKEHRSDLYMFLFENAIKNLENNVKKVLDFFLQMLI